jgi:hypothetical protein
MSGKVVFDVGIGEAQCARMLGMDQRKSDLVAAHSPISRHCLLQRILDELLESRTPQRGNRFYLAKQRIGQINRRSHKTILT